MLKYFEKMMKYTPDYIEYGDYFFDTNGDGDNFDSVELEQWYENKGLIRRWNSSYNRESIFAEKFGKQILEMYSKLQCPLVDVASGPGFGLVPLILSEYPDVECLASDASVTIIKLLRRFVDTDLKLTNISLGAFSLFDLPFQDNSIDLFTSFIGIGSTRNGESGWQNALENIYRKLKPGGYFIGIENEYLFNDDLIKAFELMGIPIWEGIIHKSTWTEKFIHAGFDIISNTDTMCVKLLKEDNELGYIAYENNLSVILNYTLYIIQKKF